MHYILYHIIKDYVINEGNNILLICYQHHTYKSLKASSSLAQLSLHRLCFRSPLRLPIFACFEYIMPLQMQPCYMTSQGTLSWLLHGFKSSISVTSAFLSPLIKCFRSRRRGQFRLNQVTFYTFPTLMT